MAYTKQELKARRLRRNGVKIAEIKKRTTLTRLQIQQCTRDIWLKECEDWKERREKTRSLFLQGIPKEEICAMINIDENRYYSWVRKFRVPSQRKTTKEYGDLVIELRERVKSILDEIRVSPVVKNGAPKGFLTIIGKELGVSGEFAVRHTLDLIDEKIFVDNNEGTWIDKETKEVYVNTTYISRMIFWRKSSISNRLTASGIPHTLLWTNLSANRHQRFYELQSIYGVPVVGELLYDARLKEGYSQSLYQYRPAELKRSHYKIFCGLLIYRNKFGSWPTNRDLALRFQQDDFSPSYVKNVMRKLMDVGYINVYYNNGNVKGTKYINVHWGPEPLITQKVWQDGGFIRADRNYVERCCRLKGAEP